MRLLLDEHYSKRIAEELRTRGENVVAVSERADLRGLGDVEILAAATRERRALATENWADFQPLLAEAAAAGEGHYGVIFTSRRRLPRSREAIGIHVDVLDAFLTAHRSEDALANSYHWLP